MTSPAVVRRHVVGLACAIATLACAGAASASPESDAKDLFARGRELRLANDCTNAVPLFRKAATVYPQALGPLRNLAECEEELGRFASARRTWLDLKRAALLVPSGSRYEGWATDAAEAALRLKPKVATFLLEVLLKTPEGETPIDEKSGVQLTVNEEALDATLLGTALERDPGDYHIRAQLAGAAPVEQTVALGAGENPRVVLRLERVAAPPVKDVAAPPAKDVVRPPATSDHRTAGWIVAGVGGAALVGAVVTLVARQNALGTIEEQCPTRRDCSEGLRDTVDTGKTMSLLTSVLFPIGILGVGAGTALIVTSNPAADARRASVRLTPTLGGFDFSGRF